MENVDFLIVGQGISGSVLAYELQKADQKIMVIDQGTELTSSFKAAGLYNPITGRKMVKTWFADKLFPNLENYYLELENHYQAKLLHPKTIYRPFYSPEEQNDWQARASDPEYAPYILQIASGSQNIPGVIDLYGGIKVNYSGYVDLPVLLWAIKKSLREQGLLKEEVFQFGELKLDEGVFYRKIRSEKIIFCDGPRATENPFWSYLPFKLVKGEILDIEADLPTDMIVNRGVFILPKNGVFRVGSTYDHENLGFVPSEKGIKSLRERLSKIYSGTYLVVSQSAGIRPATFDRKPFIGTHDKFQQVGIFNGFGTKGVSLVPYFAKQLVNYLLHHDVLNREVDVKRV